MNKNEKKTIDRAMMERAYAMIALTAESWPITTTPKKKKIRPSRVRCAHIVSTPTNSHNQVKALMDAMMPSYLHCPTMR